MKQESAMTQNDNQVSGLTYKMSSSDCHGLDKGRPLANFGLLPISEGMDGPDHNAGGFSVWVAGGVKGGTIIGATDQYGNRAVENPKSVYDLHATILPLLGLDHEKLTYR